MNNDDVRAKLDEIFSRGLRSGKGEIESGRVCVEQAIALAHGEGLTDSPSCVDPTVRAYAIRINDAAWSTVQARATGLRELAFAQLGTATGFDAVRFASKLAELTIRRVLPLALRAVGLSTSADRCEKEGTKDSAVSAYAASDAASDAAAYAYAADAAAAAAAYAYDAAAAAAAYAYAADAAAAAAAYARGAACTSAAAADADSASDYVLRESTSCAVEAIAYARA